MDLEAAVALVTGKGLVDPAVEGQSQADARVRNADGFAVLRSDLWTYDAPRVAVAGSDQRTYATAVAGA